MESKSQSLKNLVFQLRWKPKFFNFIFESNRLLALFKNSTLLIPQGKDKMCVPSENNNVMHWKTPRESWHPNMLQGVPSLMSNHPPITKTYISHMIINRFCVMDSARKWCLVRAYVLFVNCVCRVIHDNLACCETYHRQVSTNLPSC